SSGRTPEGQLIAIDLTTGDRTVTSAPASVDGYAAIGFDDVTGHPLVVSVVTVAESRRIGQLVTVNVDTALITPVSPIAIGTGPAIASPSDVAFDRTTGRALVLDRLQGLVA